MRVSMRVRMVGALALLGSGAALGGCGGGEELPASAVNEAKEIFTQRCVACHGATGKGDGVGAATLDPKPRDYTSAEWQKSVTDEQLEKIIVGGGPAVGKSATMPPNPDLEKKPLVVKALRAQVRAFGKK